MVRAGRSFIVPTVRFFSARHGAEGGRVSALHEALTDARALIAPRVVHVALLGYGRVGQAVAELAYRDRPRLLDAGVELRISGALVRDRARPRGGPPLRLMTDAHDATKGRIDAVIEVMGGLEPARSLVAASLAARVPVVTANKTLIARCGEPLRRLAASRRTSIAFDAAVLAGVPFLGSLARRPLVSAATRIEGIVNGTSQFVVGAMAKGVSFDAALADAIARGYAEPDSEADVSGRDAAEKLAIVLQLAGHGAAVDDLPRTRIDVLHADDFACARALQGAIKPVAFASFAAGGYGAWVGPAFVAASHPFASLGGVDNALRLTGRNGDTVSFAGPGAGPEATALTILDDLIETLAGGHAELPPPLPLSVASPLREPPPGRWFLSVDSPSRSSQLTPGVDLSADGAAITAPLPWAEIDRRVGALRSSGARVLVLPVLD
jgi:homoserine dehydrogenase